MMSYYDMHAGFALTNVKLQIAEIQQKQNQFYITNLDEVYFSEEIDFEKDKETKITSLLQAAFEELSIKNSISSKSVSFSLPQELYITARFPFDDSLPHSSLIEELRWRFSTLYPYFNWNDFVIRYYEVDQKYTQSNNVALVFSINRKYLKLAADFCENNNLKLKYIDHIHLASNNCLVMNSSSKSEILLSLYMSHKILSVLISKNNMPAYYEDIPIKDSHEIRNIVANKISELNQQQFIFSEAYLFGDIASISIANTLSDECGMNFKLVNPFTQFKTATNLMTNKYYTETNHFFTPSAGIAIRL